MNIDNLISAQINGHKAIRATLNGRVVWTPATAATTATQALIDGLFADGQRGFLFGKEPVVDGRDALFKNMGGTGLVTAQGDLVGQLVDMTPNGFNAIARTASTRAVYPGLRYNGSNSAYDVPQHGMLVNSAGVLVGVNFSVDAITPSAKYITGATTERRDDGSGSDLVIVYVVNSEIRIGGRRTSNESFQYATVGTLVAGQTYTFIGYVDFSTATARVIIDGQESTVPFQTPGTTDGIERGIGIGARYLATSYFPGTIGEVVMRDGPATVDDIALLDSKMIELRTQPTELTVDFARDDQELSTYTASTTVTDEAVIIGAPTLLDYHTLSGTKWSRYFLVLDDAQGRARQLRLNNASEWGYDQPGQYLGAWSTDPHSDVWNPLTVGSVSGGIITAAELLPADEPVIAIADMPAYTTERIYAKTAEYRQSPHVISAPSADANGNYGYTLEGYTDWKGRAVPALPMPVYRIGDGVSTGKNTVVLVCGDHSNEHHADYNFEGAIDFLISEEPEAVFLRQWCDIFAYPTDNPAGRYSGFSRSNPEIVAKSLSEEDHNRRWGLPGLSNITATKNAFQADFGAKCDVLIAFHSFWMDRDSVNRGLWLPLTEGLNYEFASRYSARDPDITTNVQAGTPSNNESLVEHAMFAMGAVISAHNEENHVANRNVPEYRASGRAQMLALYDMINDGLMPLGPA